MFYESVIKHFNLACSALYDRQISQIFCIIDLSGFSLAIWNKKTIGLVKRALKINADYYPEIMGKMIISNAPSIFSGIWGLIKGWVDEKTRKKICIVGNPQKVLSEFLDIDNLPKFLGGKNEAPLTKNVGPWNEYELIDSTNPDAIVGIKRKDDPLGKIFTPHDMCLMENPCIDGMGISGTKGAMVTSQQHKAIPYMNANISSPIIDAEKYIENEVE